MLRSRIQVHLRQKRLTDVARRFVVCLIAVVWLVCVSTVRAQDSDESSAERFLAPMMIGGAPLADLAPSVAPSMADYLTCPGASLLDWLIRFEALLPRVVCIVASHLRLCSVDAEQGSFIEGEWTNGAQPSIAFYSGSMDAVHYAYVRSVPPVFVVDPGLSASDPRLERRQALSWASEIDAIRFSEDGCIFLQVSTSVLTSLVIVYCGSQAYSCPVDSWPVQPEWWDQIDGKRALLSYRYGERCDPNLGAHPIHGRACLNTHHIQYGPVPANTQTVACHAHRADLLWRCRKRDRATSESHARCLARQLADESSNLARNSDTMLARYRAAMRAQLQLAQ